jgi:hypothetical protein
MMGSSRLSLRRVLFFALTLIARGAAAGAESTVNGNDAVHFDMERLIAADPYDAAALEERFAASRDSRGAGGSEEKDLSALAVGYALARAKALAGSPAEARKTLEKTEAMLRRIRGDGALRATISAHVYLELIVDGPTWVLYNPSLESAIAAMAEAGAPQADISYVEAKRLALFPPEIGGDPARSLALFDSIGEGRGLFEFAARYASALIAAGDRKRAREMLESRAAADGRDAGAADLLGRLRAEDSGAAVKAVVLPSGTRIARDMIAKAIRLRAGMVLSARAADEDLGRLGELPGVARADIRCRYDEGSNEVEVEYRVAEERSRSLSIFASKPRACSSRERNSRSTTSIESWRKNGS